MRSSLLRPLHVVKTAGNVSSGLPEVRRTRVAQSLAELPAGVQPLELNWVGLGGKGASAKPQRWEFNAKCLTGRAELVQSPASGIRTQKRVASSRDSRS